MIKDASNRIIAAGQPRPSFSRKLSVPEYRKLRAEQAQAGYQPTQGSVSLRLQDSVEPSKPGSILRMKEDIYISVDDYSSLDNKQISMEQGSLERASKSHRNHGRLPRIIVPNQKSLQIMVEPNTTAASPKAFPLSTKALFSSRNHSVDASLHSLGATESLSSILHSARLEASEERSSVIPPRSIEKP